MSEFLAFVVAVLVASAAWGITEWAIARIAEVEKELLVRAGLLIVFPGTQATAWSCTISPVTLHACPVWTEFQPILPGSVAANMGVVRVMEITYWQGPGLTPWVQEWAETRDGKKITIMWEMRYPWKMVGPRKEDKE